MTRRSDADLIAALVAAGGDVARRHQFALTPGEVVSKANATDLLTRADAEAEAAMVDLLIAERPDDSIVGEEGAAREGSSGRTWVLDPVDGTYNFVRGSERWCSAAALVVDGVARLGATFAPRGDRLVVGGQGVPVTDAGRVLAPIRDVALSESSLLTYLHPPHHSTEVGEAWRRLVGGTATWRSSGSGSLDAADVCAGVADLSVQHSVPLWDSAPGEAMVRSLGGASARVWAGGVEWFLLGSPTAVMQATSALTA